MGKNWLQSLLFQAKSYLRGIQKADDRRKKRWLIGASIIAIILILGLWVFYLSVALPQLEKKSETAVAKEVPRGEGSSFLKTFIRGFSVTIDRFKEKISGLEKQTKNYLNNLVGALFSSNKFSIEGNNQNFFENSPEPIPPTPLP